MNKLVKFFVWVTIGCFTSLSLAAACACCAESYTYAEAPITADSYEFKWAQADHELQVQDLFFEGYLGDNYIEQTFYSVSEVQRHANGYRFLHTDQDRLVFELRITLGESTEPDPNTPVAIHTKRNIGFLFPTPENQYQPVVTYHELKIPVQVEIIGNRELALATQKQLGDAYLILQGDGNECLNANDLTHWKLWDSAGLWHGSGQIKIITN